MAAFTANMPNILAQLAQTAGSAGINVQSRATITLGNRPVLQRRSKGHVQRGREWEHTHDVVSTADFDSFRGISAQNWTNNIVTREPQVRICRLQSATDTLPPLVQLPVV